MGQEATVLEIYHSQKKKKKETGHKQKLIIYFTSRIAELDYFQTKYSSLQI